MGDIQRPPTGLWGMLGTKDMGQNPRVIGDVVQPVIDLSAFYQAQDLTTKIETGVATLTVGTGAQVVVPNGEYWQLLAVGGLWSTFTAGSVFACALELGFLPNLVPVLQMENRITISAGATDQVRLGWTPGERTILSPGMCISNTLLLTMAAVATPQVRVLYIKLQ